MDRENIEDQLSILFEKKLQLLKKTYKPYISKTEPDHITKSASSLSYRIDNHKRASKKKPEYV